MGYLYCENKKLGSDRDRSTDPPAPMPTVQFRRRAWLEFQRAIDPLAPPKPLKRPPRQH